MSEGLDLGLDALDAAQPGGAYQVLARKHRPQTFADLIGQEAMVKTLTNAFAQNRIAHAFMLTGVRGVGKTTTARLLARALNYETDEVRQPSIDLDPPGRHCKAIAESRHMDVMEMDAASRTGIGDIREILDNVRYAPVEARTKVYIIDEVHMLSTAAFNGLLKTLEEPPPHCKFIFATTEIRKVPITVLSRCQRFDLKRVAPEQMIAHLRSVCAQEGASVDEAGLAMIARASEGSVRDALSLLDQAIVQNLDGGPVSAEAVRDMLGMADRGRVIDLLEMVLKGDAPACLKEVEDQDRSGADPAAIMRDLLEMTHRLALAKELGAEALADGAPEEGGRLETLARPFDRGALTRLWRMAMRGFEDTQKAPDPLAAAQMNLIAACAAMGLPGPEEAARLLRGEGVAAAAPSAGASPAPSPSAAPAPSPAARVADGFASVVAILEEARDVDVLIDVERYVRPARVEGKTVTFEAAPGAPKDLAQRLAKALKTHTGETWAVLASERPAGTLTIAEQREAARRRRLEEAAGEPLVAGLLGALEGASLLRVIEPEAEPNQDQDQDQAIDDERSRGERA